MKGKWVVACFTGMLFLFQCVALGADGSCDLPGDLGSAISRRYPGRQIVTLKDLDDYDRGLFQKDHRDACPGLVSIDFYGDGKPTLALVLVPKTGPKSKAELVVAHRIGAAWRTALLGTARDSVPVVWKQEPGEYKDVNGKATIRATNPVIVFCGYEAWAIVYSWSHNRVAKVWLSD